MDNVDKPLLSVVIATYNHERYIRKALDSVLMQRINFPMEVLIGDDASTDQTPEILKWYEKEYPGVFTVIYREKNTYQDPRAIKNFTDLHHRTCGKYSIVLEGDDYWCDPFKLQKQVDFLESHPEYIAVAHNVQVVDENNDNLKRDYPECKLQEYTTTEFCKGLMPGQTASLMYRNIYNDGFFNTEILDKGYIPGDKLKVFVLLIYGKIFVMQEIMSCYRFVTNGGSSFSAKHTRNYNKALEFYDALFNYAHSNSDARKENIIAAEYVYSENIMSGIRRNDISIILGMKKLWRVSYKRTVFQLLLQRGKSTKQLK